MRNLMVGLTFLVIFMLWYSGVPQTVTNEVFSNVTQDLLGNYTYLDPYNTETPPVEIIVNNVIYAVVVYVIVFMSTMVGVMNNHVIPYMQAGSISFWYWFILFIIFLPIIIELLKLLVMIYFMLKDIWITWRGKKNETT